MTSPALPTSGTPTYTALTSDGTTVITGNQSAIFLTLGTSTVMYETDSTNNSVDKYTENTDGTWTSDGRASLPGAEDLVASISGGDVNLYVTTSSDLYEATDTSGAAGTITNSLFGSTPVPTLTADAGEQFRGLAFAVPEPGSLTLLGGAVLAVLGRRRRK